MARPLRAWRMDKGWSQAALAAAAGVSTLTVSNLETGHRPRPHPRTRKALADALGCTVSDVAEFRDAGTDQDAAGVPPPA